MTHNNTASHGAEEYPDDGHIFVCVRVRDVPHNTACLTNSSSNVNSGTRTSTVVRKSMVRDAQKICVSVVENVVVMHDPKALDDAATVAKDGNNVVQLLTDRANRMNAVGRPSRKTNGGGAAAGSAMTRTNSRRTSTLGGGGGGRAYGPGNSLVPTGTANYYECDRCIASMEQPQLLQMPLIRTSDFLQPPPYGTQEDVYRHTAMHAVKAAVEGINSCVFAYGQTGSGKTYTLFGDTTNIRRDPGVVPRAVDDLFRQLEAVKESYRGNEETDYSYNVQLSFFEIYQNEVYCLFSRQGPLHVQFLRDPAGKKETMTINDLQQQTVASADKAYPLIEMGLRRRQTAETGMNARSSRSHAILQIRVAQYRTNRDTRETVEHQATINLVDLAGSERQKTANTDGKSRDEGIHINQSLATLARVINDIAGGAKFVNYRDSLLTMVLKDNLGGNSKTFMIANISPISFSFSESCATLTYAKDVRKIRNRPMVNKTFQTRTNLLEQNSRLKQENEKLKEQMEAWVRNLQGGGAADVNWAQVPMFRTIQQRIASAATMGNGGSSPPPQDQQHPQGRAMMPFSVSQLAAGGNDAFLSATSAGLTAPLLISSHRRYTSVAGIGGSCVEGGVVRVSALVKETMQFPLRCVLDPAGGGGVGGTKIVEVKDSEKEPASPNGEDERHTTILMETDNDDDGDDGEEHAGGHGKRRASASPDAVPTDFPHDGAAAAAVAPSNMADLGVLQLDRVALRSCEQRYYVHFVPPTTEDGIARLIDVQVNGKSIGAKNRRELHHGDVVCAYLEDSKDTAVGLRAQSLVSFHYVDLNSLARNMNGAALGSATTLGQIAVSVDIPEDLENLTLEGIKQLQRDNAKLLDMVRQQAETIDFQCARASVSQASRANLIEGISSIGSPESVSPDPRSVEPSPSAVMPLEQRTAVAVAEAFRRLSEPHGLRGGSVMPADIAADELLRRAAAQSASQQRLDSAVKENEKLHRTVVSRNATLDALAKRLAELEAGGDDYQRDVCSSSSRSSSSSAADAASHRTTSSSPSSVSLSPSADYDDKVATVVCPHDKEEVGVSMTRVSSPSATRDASESPQKHKKKQKAVRVLADDDEDDEDEEEPIGDGKRRVVYDNTEGARERYAAVVREREQFDHIVELEEVIRDLRERLAELESRLRFAKDETLEQQMFHEQAEAERMALLEELDDARRENNELRGDNASLEAFLAKDEQALADAARLTEEEVHRQTSLLVDRITALKALARMWKQRTMKYIAMCYGAGDGSDAMSAAAHLDAIPWDDLRAAETVAIAKKRLGGTSSGSSSPVHHGARSSGGGGGVCTAEMAQTIEDFEKDTAEENLRALEYALLDFEQENQRLQDEIRRIQAELQRFKDLIDRLRSEKTDMERQLADATDATDEERRRMQRLLDDTNRQLDEAEGNWKETQGRLDEAVALCDNNKRKAAKNNELLFAQQKRTIEGQEAQIARLRSDVASKDEELRNLTQYMEDHDALGGDGVAKSYELRSRIEEMVADTADDFDAPTGYSVFPAGYEFSDEMVALIRICLRILLDRLKMELYVLNSQSVHKFSLLIHAVKARTEAHFHTFMHQLRDAVSQMTGRVVRPGGKWGLSEADVLANLVDHRRRQVGDALNGLLIWYDHWDSAPKMEHVAYMELIRNADRILQMARLVRRESLLNTNATSTSLMPVPGKNISSEMSLVAEGPKRKDRSVKDSCKILSRMNSSTRQSNLARAVTQFSATPSRATIAAREDANLGGVESTPFSRSATATALVLSQSMIPFSRSATATRGSVQPPSQQQQQHANASTLSHQTGGVSPAHGENGPTFTRCLSGLPRPSATATPSSFAAVSTPMRPTKSNAGEATVTSHAIAAGAPSPAAAAARANYTRMASAGVLPVSEADVAYVATTDVAEAVSINSYNFSRRMSATPAEMAERGEPAASAARQPNHPFSRCHTSIPQSQRPPQQHQPQQRQQRDSTQALRRLSSAVPLRTRVSGTGGPRTSQRRPSDAKATEAFARSKTQYHPQPAHGRLARRGSDLACRDSVGSGAASPSVRGSLQHSTNLSGFCFPSSGRRQQGSGSDSRTSQRRSSMLHNSLTKPPAAAPFYSPAVLRSLRERSTSDANRASSAAAGGGKLMGSKKKAASPTATGASKPFSRTSSDVPSKKKVGGNSAAFQKTQSAPRVSGVVKGRLSSENVPGASSGAPQVPRLNFTGVAGNA
ncbi:putative kinesin [Leptomonas pyrrhocoris]|uniref:Putative kinesin n=1 Tax=Leptomonas pyrrhocoris TaxID=157538 RepID=A0A0M9FY20_LEPPY|nr:putative kinesin [Leptomonas pyrrhocoris]KPA78269.1 putative kinesin [Leptomonas pyrrhocoris]|eukprot:XP_015656708.1 putative kinesin [Leptomonas pyrrhocoris]